MAKAEPKTQKTKASVAAFIAAVESDTRRKDAKVVDKMLREITGEKPAMWGPSIIGYGECDLPTGTWPRAAFSPRKANLVVYLVPATKDPALLKKLGKHKMSVSCLYINMLADVDESVLRTLVERGARDRPPPSTSPRAQPSTPSAPGCGRLRGASGGIGAETRMRTETPRAS